MMVTMSINGWRSSDLQSFLEITIYVLVFALGAYYLESIKGLDAIRHLNPEYPYEDKFLLPSLFYLLGFFEHATS